jgi:hypothetical protein
MNLQEQKIIVVDITVANCSIRAARPSSSSSSIIAQYMVLPMSTSAIGINIMSSN